MSLLDAYEDGHNRQADAEARVGIHGQAFQNLVRRFKTIRGRLSDELRNAAFHAIVGDGGAPLATRARPRGGDPDLLGRRSANDSMDSVAAESTASNDDVDVENSQDAA